MISLNGIWELSTDKRFRNDRSYAVSVPSCVGYEIPALRTYRGDLWYKKRFDVSGFTTSQNYLLEFSAVNYYADVYLNGKQVGSHEGGYAPFVFNVSKLLKVNNELVVKVLVPGDSDPMYPFDEIPHGKQEDFWYGLAGGIWQEVTLIRTGIPYIAKLRIHSDSKESKTYFKIGIEGQEKNLSTHVLLKLHDPHGKSLVNEETRYSAKSKQELFVEKPILWDTLHPNLYSLEVGILSGDTLIDSVTETFGFRTIEVKDGELFLNGKRLFLVGALNQDFYPRTHYMPPSEEFVRDDLYLAKEMGLNCLRYHLKLPNRWYLKWADRLGLLIWVDLPNWSTSTLRARSRGEDTLWDMVDLDYNHPSVIARTIINESWGLDLQNVEEREWLMETYDTLKSRDPDRIAVDNSPCAPNFHVKTDIEDFHNYFFFPGQFHEMRSWVAEFAARPAWSFFSKDQRRGHEPLILSEFGNWGLPFLSRLREYYGGDPDWFRLGDTQQCTMPLEAEDRFWEYGLNKVFESPKQLYSSFQDLQGQALRFQIEEIRKHPEIKGYVITEFTDVYWEANGLLDITRGKKTFYDSLKSMNALDMVFPRDRPLGVWSKDNFSLPILFSHLSDRKLQDIEIIWSVSDTEFGGKLTSKNVPFGLKEIGSLDFVVPEVEDPRLFQIPLKTKSGKKLIHENQVDLFVVPHRFRKEVSERVDVIELKALKDGSLFDKHSVRQDHPDILFACGWNRQLVRFAELGKTIVVDLSTSESFSDLGYTLRKREGLEEARWVNGLGMFHQRLVDKVFGNVIIDHKFRDCFPTHFLQGDFNFNAKTLAGMIIGWLYKPMNFLVNTTVGNGNIFLTTFPLKGWPESPNLTLLLDRIIRHAN